jgi:glycosyltransferase involved in cell wall biosynthesis
MDIVIGIDASRNKSGGARAHIIGILADLNPCLFGVKEVHIWAYIDLLRAIPDKPWLIKHNPPALEQSLAKKLWWQATQLSRAAREVGCSIMFASDASTLCRFRPFVVLSQDMLSYEPGMMKHFGISKARLRLLSILIVQNLALRAADGALFLTRYAGEVIQKSCGRLTRIAYVPHGVGMNFKSAEWIKTEHRYSDRPLSCLYVSNTAMYKHQWNVVRAIAELRRRGYNLKLMLVGGGSGAAQQLLEAEIEISDPEKSFVTQMDFLDHSELPALLANADCFIFASSCENLPVTLLEAMAVGLPIACSNRGPMPDVLMEGGIYFDPEHPDSIVVAVKKIIEDAALRQKIARRAKQLAAEYSWSRCSHETFSFLVETYKSHNQVRSKA